jgi:hypothetical protein
MLKTDFLVGAYNCTKRMTSSADAKITAALSSKRMIEPSGRRTPNFVRTTTAFITSPAVAI